MTLEVKLYMKMLPKLHEIRLGGIINLQNALIKEDVMDSLTLSSLRKASKPSKGTVTHMSFG